MTISLRRCKRILIASALAAQMICLSFFAASCTSAQAQSPPLSIDDGFIEGISATSPAEDNYSRWLYEKYSSTVIGNAEWLRDMMTALEILPEGAGYDEMITAACDKGIIRNADISAYAALTRRFAASTIVNALGYDFRVVSPVSDAVVGDDIMTLAYYGYFLPDDEDKLNPDAVVTDEEYDRLIAELKRRSKLQGKRLLTFGDSIMYGAGNDGEGIADIIAEKYGMTVRDYSVSGATFGTYKERSHIADQIREAVNEGATADIILIDGGTNDMMGVDFGTMTKNFSFVGMNENTFAGGMEYALALLNKFYYTVPVVYIRAHDMDIDLDSNEERYGEYALSIAAKWAVSSVDIYTDSDMNTQVKAIRDKYTSYKEKYGHADSIHPTALGYAKYYLPLISEKVVGLL